MLYFIDTNIFLRILIKEDEKIFNECYKLLELIRERKIKSFTSSLILAETNWVLDSFYKFEKPKIIKALRSILNLKGLKIIDEVNPAISLEIFQNHNVKLIDALIASNPAILNKTMTIISYDKDFEKIDIIRKEPKQVIQLIKNFT